MRGILVFFCLLLLAGLAAPANASIMLDNLFAPAAGPKMPHWFAMAFQSSTLTGGRKYFSCLRKLNPEIPAALYKFDQVPMAGVSSPYVVAVASYASQAEALASLRELRARIKASAISVCVGAGPINAPVEAGLLFQVPTNALLHSIGQAPRLRNPPLTDVAHQLARSPLGAFDAIGESRFAAGSDTAQALVLNRKFESANGALAAIDALKSAHPTVRFSIIQKETYYIVTIGARTSKERLSQAVLEARRLGLYEFEIADVTAPVFGSTGDSSTLKLIERDDLVVPLQKRVTSCFETVTKLNVPSGHPVSVPPATLQQIASCSGLVTDNVGLTRCLLESDCRGPRVPIKFDVSAPAIIRTCLRSVLDTKDTPPNGALAADIASGIQSGCPGTTLNIQFLKFVSSLKLEPCLAEGAARTCVDVPATVSQLCAMPNNGTWCENHSDDVRILTRRLDEIADCLTLSKCNPVVPRSADPIARFNSAASAVGLLANQSATIAVNGIAFLDNAPALPDALKQCANVADAKAKADCFIRLGLKPSEQKIFDCAIAAAGGAALSDGALSACILNGNYAGDAAKQLATARCLAQNASSPDNWKTCGLATSEAARVQTGVACVQSAASPLDALKACQGLAPAQVSAAAACIVGKHDAPQLTKCLPDGFGVKARTVSCIMSASDDAGALSCATSYFGTETTARLESCATQAHLDPAALAACGFSQSQFSGPLSTLDCFRKVGNAEDAVTKCTAILPPEVQAISGCITAGTDLDALEKCLPADAVAKVDALQACLKGGSAPLSCAGAVATNLHLSNDQLAAIACVTSNSSASAMLTCAPGLSPDEKAGACLLNAQGEAEQAACLSTRLTGLVDPKTLAAATCLAQSAGESEAMAQCAAQALLPGELGKLAGCAVNSTGTADLALCASPLQLNPEWRIAAECAVESGGVPVTFAACAAGRLAVRELTKCLQGEIGTEQGCFGPNNTIVVAFRTIGNDLINGPGENNDIRKALGTVTNPMKDEFQKVTDRAINIIKNPGDCLHSGGSLVSCATGGIFG